LGDAVQSSKAEDRVDPCENPLVLSLNRRIAWLAGGGWFGIAFAMAAGAGWFRFGSSYNVEDQFAVQILTVAECAMATAGLTCSLPILVKTAVSQGAAKTTVFAVAVPVFFAFGLQIIAMETDEANRAKNREYLTHQADIILQYEHAKSRMPESFDRALEWSGEHRHWRGDADGNDVTYHKIDKQHFLICANKPRLHLLIAPGRVDVSTWPANQPDPCR
jgi:hypothetical protein